MKWEGLKRLAVCVYIHLPLIKLGRKEKSVAIQSNAVKTEYVIVLCNW